MRIKRRQVDECIKVAIQKTANTHRVQSQYINSTYCFLIAVTEKRFDVLLRFITSSRKMLKQTDKLRHRAADERNFRLHHQTHNKGLCSSSFLFWLMSVIVFADKKLAFPLIGCQPVRWHFLPCLTEREHGARQPQQLRLRVALMCRTLAASRHVFARSTFDST